MKKILFLALFLLPLAVLAGEDTGSINNSGPGSGLSGVVSSDPTASPVAGTYSSSQSVTLSGDGAQYLCYTTDGTDPVCDWNALTCSTGSKYSSALSIATTTTVKAIACYTAFETSAVSSHVYTISSGGGGGGGGGGGARSCTKPPFTNISPAKNETLTSLSVASFSFTDADPNTAEIHINSIAATVETIDNSDGSYTVTGTLDTPITENGTYLVSISAQKSSSCGRTLFYNVSVGNSAQAGEDFDLDAGTDNGSADGGEMPEASVTGFIDIVGHWGETYINTLFTWGAINGKSITIFDPDANITRAEAIKIALLVKGVNIPDDVLGMPFPDVVLSAWYAPYVHMGKELEIIGGFPDGNYGPNMPVSRVEALKILLLAAGVDVEGYSTVTPFNDVESYAWYAPLVAWASDNNIVSGIGGEKFAPHQKITRAEFTKIAVLIFNKVQ